jgi:hypothetical protein
VALRLRRDDLDQKGAGTITFLTTDDPDRFAATGSLFLGMSIAPADVELVNL